MATTTLSPNSDVSTGNWSNDGGAASFHAAVTDGSDTTFVEWNSANSETNLLLGMTSTPGNFVTATACTISVRCQVSTTKRGESLDCSIVKSDGTTALTDTQSPSVTTSFSTFTLTMTIQGTPTKTDWDGARLKLVGTPGGSSDTTDVAEASVTLTYTPSAGTTNGLTVPYLASVLTTTVVANNPIGVPYRT